MFLSCRPFVAITTLSTGLVGVEVTSVSWLGQLTVGVFSTDNLASQAKMYTKYIIGAKREVQSRTSLLIGSIYNSYLTYKTIM